MAIGNSSAVRIIAEFPFESIFSGDRRSSWLLRLFWLIIPLEYSFAVMSGFVSLAGNVLFAPMLVMLKMLVLLIVCLCISKTAQVLKLVNLSDARVLAGSTFTIWFLTYAIAVACSALWLLSGDSSMGGPIQDWAFDGGPIENLIFYVFGAGPEAVFGSYPQSVLACFLVMLVYGAVAYCLIVWVGYRLRHKSTMGSMKSTQVAPYGLLGLLLSTFLNALFTAALLAS